MTAISGCLVAWLASTAPADAVSTAHSMEDERSSLKEQIRRAFADTPRPADSALRNSSEGDEPYLVERDFKDKRDWRLLEAAFLDQAPDGYSSALSFFSAEAFRYFIPAYLVADIDGLLKRADPTFHLWHGLDNETKGEKVNPRRYRRSDLV